MTGHVEYRLFCFTVNNPTQEAHDWLAKYARKCQWLVYGHEFAPTTGTPHLQGILYTTKPRRKFNMVRAFKKISGWVGCPTDTSKGPDYWEDYCTKQDKNPKVFGIPPTQEEFEASLPKGQGYRSDLSSFVNAVQEEKPPREVLLESELYMRHHRHCDAVIDFYYPPKELPELNNEWYYGPVGVGKSRKVRGENPDAYWKAMNKWWDDYHDQDVVILEDIEPQHKHMGWFIKIWADHYPFRAEYKGGSRMIRPKRIIVTSNYSPEEIFDEPLVVQAVQRRFKIIHFMGDFLSQVKN